MKRKIFYIVLFFWGLSLNTYAQNQTLADSLITYLDVHPEISDSLRYTVLKHIAAYSTSPSQSIHYSNQAKAIAEKEGNYVKLAAVNTLIGRAYKEQGKLVLALENFITSERYYKAANNVIGQGAVYAEIASLYSIQENYKSAHSFIDKALKIFKEQKDTIRYASLLQNKGNTFRKTHEPDSALVYFNESIRLFTIKDAELYIAYNLGNIGLTMAMKRDFKEGELKLKKALQILEKYGDSYAISDFSNQMVKLYIEYGRIEEAFPLAYNSLDLATRDGLKEQIRDASLRLSELYSQAENYQKAYQYHSQYVAYRDSINSEETIRKIADLRTEYEVSQKQAEIDLLNQKRERHNIIGLSLAVFTLLLLVLAFLLYRTIRIKRSANRLLHAQNNQLEQQHSRLEKLNNTKDRFFSIISHDLRGPVNAFNGISELIKYYIAQNEMGQLREVSEYIDKSARQLSTLLDNLLDWSLKQQGTFPLRSEMLSLNPLLQEVTDMFRISAFAKNITLNLHIEETINVWADRNSLMTILRNIVNNAIKFTQSDGLVTISAYTEKGFVHINVIDTGVGIPEEKLEGLFILQDKVIGLGTAGEKGLGLGLSLAQEFTQMNGGTLIVNSELGAGTIITIKLPLFPDSQKVVSACQKQETTIAGK